MRADGSFGYDYSHRARCPNVRCYGETNDVRDRSTIIQERQICTVIPLVRNRPAAPHGTTTKSIKYASSLHGHCNATCSSTSPPALRPHPRLLITTRTISTKLDNTLKIQSRYERSVI